MIEATEVRERRRRVRFSRFSWLFGLLAIVIVASACKVGLAPAAASDNTSTTGVQHGTFTTDVKIMRGSGGATMVVIPVTIDGHGPYQFALDTGASVTLLDSGIADDLGLQTVGDPEQVSGVGGNETVTPVSVSKWHAGDITLPDATITKAHLRQVQGSTELDGLLGSDILSQFGVIQLDYKAGTLTVTS